MKHLFYLFTICLFMGACSDSGNRIIDDTDDPNGENPSSKLVKLKMSTKQAKANIFEMVEFDLRSEKSFTLFDLGKSYDSVVWKVTDLKGGFDVYQKTSHGSRFSFTWGHNFFLPSLYQTILYGYQNNKIIYSDTISMDIRNDKDFLGYNWKDITSPSKGSMGYADMLTKDELTTYSDFEDGAPSVTLFLWRSTGERETMEWGKKCKTFLSDYINSLYSKPMYDIDNAALLSENYNKLFRQKKDKEEPLAIWKTAKANIVLLKYLNDYSDFHQYKIYAEPV